MSQFNEPGFNELGVHKSFDAALAEAGYEQPSPIQALAIPALLAGHDVLGIAQTGTGKTAAFGLPLLQLLHADATRAGARAPRALVLAPTRELAIQIQRELKYFAGGTRLRLAVIYGGVGQNPQVRALRDGVDILVATPGRLLDLVEQRHVDLSAVQKLVLDEADRLLDMGFVRDVKRIVALTPKTRQSLLFSATMPQEVARLAGDILRQPQRIEVTPEQPTVEKIDQSVLHVSNPDKRDVLLGLLREPAVTKAVVFARTKHGAERLAKQLRASGVDAEAIHGNKSQNARNRTLDNFSSNRIWVLVATDIAARGIDIDGISHVINFELPHEPESYVHRIGRTARAGASGCAWSLVDPEERKRLGAVERLIRMRIPVRTVGGTRVEGHKMAPEPVDQSSSRRGGSRTRFSAPSGDRAQSQRRRRRRGRRTGEARVA